MWLFGLGCVVLCLVPWSTTASVYDYDELLTLPDRQTVVHLFEWKWTDVAKECEDFLHAFGFGAVQVSPPNEHITVDVNGDMPWWVRYQPVSYKLTSRSGSEAEFTDMVTRCNKVGVRIIVDVVLNHMVGIGQKKGVDGRNSSGDSDFDGTAGIESFPGVPYLRQHTHDDVCNHDIQGSDYQNSATDVRNCRLVGLIDLDQGNPYVRGKMQNYLNKLISLGVVGFRFDASKHMWPTDLEKLLAGVNNLRADIFGAGQRPFVVHEVIDRGGEAVKVTDYLEIGRYTNFNFGAAVSAAARSQSNWSDLLHLGPGFGYGSLGDNDVLNFIDNHDNQRDSAPYVVTYKEADLYRLAVGFLLAWTYGVPRVMSSYAFSTSDQGPPHGAGPDYPTKSPTFDPISLTCNSDSGWVCEHRWPQIRRMTKFRQVTAGTAPNLVYNHSSTVIGFARSQKGYFAINGGTTAQTIIVKTSLPVGLYCDVFQGDLINGSCTGAAVQVEQDGSATILVPAKQIIAIHVESRTQGKPVPPPPPASWQTTVILLRRPTKPSQDIFLRGGNIQLGSCNTDPGFSQITSCLPIVHTSNASFIFAEYLMWRQGDDFLDFNGAEWDQGTHDGIPALGTPTFYSTNDPSAPEYSPFNKFGPDYWLVQLKMDCSKTYDRWFEFKGYENNGIGWEPDILQGVCTGSANAGSPFFSSNTHIAKCGFLNVFEWGEKDCIINFF